MIRQETLRELLAVRLDLEARLLDLASGEGPAERAAYRELSRRRDQVYATINQVLAAEFREASGGGVEILLGQLAAAIRSLRSVATAFRTVNEVIGKVDQILQLATELVTVARAV